MEYWVYAFLISIPSGTIKSCYPEQPLIFLHISIPSGTIKSANALFAALLLSHFNSFWYD